LKEDFAQKLAHFGGEMASFSAQPMSAVGGAASDWLWETEGNADVSE